jgi:hypothetical protein
VSEIDQWGLDPSMKQEHLDRCEAILKGKAGRSAQRVLSKMEIPAIHARLENILTQEVSNRSPAFVARRIFLELLRVLSAVPEGQVDSRRKPGQLEGPTS